MYKCYIADVKYIIKYIQHIQDYNIYTIVAQRFICKIKLVWFFHEGSNHQAFERYSATNIMKSIMLLPKETLLRDRVIEM
jgi:hypothetical protein